MEGCGPTLSHAMSPHPSGFVSDTSFVTATVTGERTFPSSFNNSRYQTQLILERIKKAVLQACQKKKLIRIKKKKSLISV